MEYSTYAPTMKATIYPILRISNAIDPNLPRMLKRENRMLMWVSKQPMNRLTFSYQSSEISATNSMSAESIPVAMKPHINREMKISYFVRPKARSNQHIYMEKFIWNIWNWNIFPKMYYEINWNSPRKLSLSSWSSFVCSPCVWLSIGISGQRIHYPKVQLRPSTKRLPAIMVRLWAVCGQTSIEAGRESANQPCSHEIMISN